MNLSRHLRWLDERLAILETVDLAHTEHYRGLSDERDAVRRAVQDRHLRRTAAQRRAPRSGLTPVEAREALADQLARDR